MVLEVVLRGLDHSTLCCTPAHDWRCDCMVVRRLDVDIAHAGLYVNVSVVLRLEVFGVMYFVCV